MDDVSKRITIPTEDALRRAQEPDSSPARPVKPRVLTNARIICSHCGVLNYRTIAQESFDAGEDSAFFCNAKCARQNRMSGMGRLTVKVRNAVIELRQGGMTPREVADDLNLSPLAVAAFLLARSSPTEGIELTRHNLSIAKERKPAKKLGRPAKVRPPVVEEDDIFSDEAIERAAQRRNLNSDMYDD